MIATTANRVANVASNGFWIDARPPIILSIGIAVSSGESYAPLPDAVKNHTVNAEAQVASGDDRSATVLGRRPIQEHQQPFQS
jgi:hypothetical protein